MKMIRTMASCLALSATLALAGTSEIFKQANADYSAGHYAEAAKSYENLLNSDGPRVSVLRNLGSTYFKMGKNGQAILSFERALVLRPRDPDLRANLKLAQDQAAIYPVTHDTFWRSILERYPARSWSLAVLATAILFPMAALAWYFSKDKARLWIGIFAAADLLVVGFTIAGLVTRSGENGRGIIVSNPATIRISPFEKADSRSTLAEGREVRLGNESNGYFWVTSKDGSQDGWVVKGEVVPVNPDRK